MPSHDRVEPPRLDRGRPNERSGWVITVTALDCTVTVIQHPLVPSYAGELVGLSAGFLRTLFLARRLVADVLPARDPAAVVPFNRGSLHAAALSWADGDTAWTDANRGVGVIPATVPTIMGGVVDMQPGIHIELGHLDALGLGRSDKRG